MAVYVDAPKHPVGRMVMCHMVADSSEELLEMADKIGVSRKWLQRGGSAREHFDVCKAKRALAVENGAQEVSSRHLVALIRRKSKDTP